MKSSLEKANKQKDAVAGGNPQFAEDRRAPEEIEKQEDTKAREDPQFAEDRRTAATMRSNLSSQLSAASLTMLTVLGVFFTFFLEKRNTTALFYICALATFLAFVVSIFIGGRAIARYTYRGRSGHWIDEEAQKRFNGQALWSLIGLVLLVLTTLTSGNAKMDDNTKELSSLRARIDTLANNNHALQAQHDAAIKMLQSMVDSIAMINHRFDSLANSAKKLKQETTDPKLKGES